MSGVMSEPATLEKLVDTVHAELLGMEPAQRIEFLDNLGHGFCCHCGRVIGEGRCYCERDE